ncbi:MAG: ribose 5-phosphate isomerase A, partial [Halanaeroarchaeum sp.]
ARSAGIPLTDLDAVAEIDLAIDGADQEADGDLVKGGGGAHAREKLVASAAERFVVVIDPSKEADRLSRAVPVEVLPPATSVVASRVRDVGGVAELRAAQRKDGPVVTDNGNLILDCDFGPIDDPGALSSSLDSLPGVVAQGLFVEMADDVVVGESGGVRTRRYG